MIVEFSIAIQCNLLWWVFHCFGSVACCTGHCRTRTVSNDNYSLLPRCYGLHPHVRYYQRRLFQRSTRLVSRTLWVGWFLKARPLMRLPWTRDLMMASPMPNHAITPSSWTIFICTWKMYQDRVSTNTNVCSFLYIDVFILQVNCCTTVCLFYATTIY